MTSSQAAKRLDISTRTINAAIASGKLRATKDERDCWLIEEADFRSYAELRAKPPQRIEGVLRPHNWQPPPRDSAEAQQLVAAVRAGHLQLSTGYQLFALGDDFATTWEPLAEKLLAAAPTA